MCWSVLGNWSGLLIGWNFIKGETTLAHVPEKTSSKNNTMEGAKFGKYAIETLVTV